MKCQRSHVSALDLPGSFWLSPMRCDSLVASIWNINEFARDPHVKQRTVNATRSSCAQDVPVPTCIWTAQTTLKFEVRLRGGNQRLKRVEARIEPKWSSTWPESSRFWNFWLFQAVLRICNYLATSTTQTKATLLPEHPVHESSSHLFINLYQSLHILENCCYRISSTTRDGSHSAQLVVCPRQKQINKKKKIKLNYLNVSSQSGK